MSDKLIIPGLGENIEKALVVTIPVAAGDTISKDQVLLELEAGKATLEIPAETAGTIKQLYVSEGDEVEIGQPYAEFEPGESKVSEVEPEAKPEPVKEEVKEEPVKQVLPEEAPPNPDPPQPQVKHLPGKHVPAAPSVRRFAREIGVDVDTVKGSGARGRVSIADVKKHARDLNSRRSSGLGVRAPELPDFSKWTPVKREKMSSIRKATAEHMEVCRSIIPHVTHFDEADITNLEALRQKYKPRAEAAGGKLTMAVMVCKAVVEGLKKFPVMNASVDMENREIIYKEQINLGVAVATERGLLVPVIHDAGRKNMIELAIEIDRLASECRSGKIKQKDMEGGTFTVTNLGRIGGSFFTPIINWPEVAIMGIGRAKEQPAFVNGVVEPRNILPLSLSYDHRIIDGAEAARFASWVAEAIAEPLILSLEGVS